MPVGISEDTSILRILRRMPNRVSALQTPPSLSGHRKQSLSLCKTEPQCCTVPHVIARSSACCRPTHTNCGKNTTLAEEKAMNLLTYFCPHVN